MFHRQTIVAIGELMQLAYVTSDLDKAFAEWAAIGVGPFYTVERAPFTEVRYRGEVIDLDLSVGFAYWGNMQIEVIRQNDRSQSIFRDWQDRGISTLHHVCVAVSDMADVRRRLTENNHEILQEKWAGAAGEFVYAKPLTGPDLLVEYALIGPPFDTAFEAMRAAAATWDGSRPVRPISEVAPFG